MPGSDLKVGLMLCARACALCRGTRRSPRRWRNEGRWPWVFPGVALARLVDRARRGDEAVKCLFCAMRNCAVRCGALVCEVLGDPLFPRGR